jgi:hypothetical protein
MSIETDFRALLAGYAPLSALVGTRIALNAVPEGSVAPLVVFAAEHDRTLGLDNTLLADRCALEVQCWAENATDADAVADAVVAAIATAPTAAGAVVTARSTTFDAEVGLDATILAAEWWA